MRNRRVTPLSAAPSAQIAHDTAAANPKSTHCHRQWRVEDEVTVCVDGTRVWDGDERRAVPAVLLRMPPHVARHLACMLDDWTTIGGILESARATDERALAGVLHEAARLASTLAESSPDDDDADRGG